MHLSNSQHTSTFFFFFLNCHRLPCQIFHQLTRRCQLIIPYLISPVHLTVKKFWLLFLFEFHLPLYPSVNQLFFTYIESTTDFPSHLSTTQLTYFYQLYQPHLIYLAVYMFCFQSFQLNYLYQSSSTYFPFHLFTFQPTNQATTSPLLNLITLQLDYL